MKNYIFTGIFFMFIIFSLSSNFTSGINVYKNFQVFFKEMITFLPFMFILIGLFDVWTPIIDESKCVGCGMCFTTCGRDIFDFNKERKKAVVARPLQCMVGYTLWEVRCIFDAISFPDKKRVRDFIKNKKILVQVKQKLEKKISEKVERITK